MSNKNGLTKEDEARMAKIMSTHDLKLILNTDEPHLRALIETPLSFFNFNGAGKKACKRLGLTTVGNLVAQWPYFVEECAKAAQTFTEYSNAKDDMEETLNQIGFPLPARDGLTPTADRLERNARLSDQALCIACAGSIAKGYEEDYKAHPEKFKDVTMYDEAGRPYYQDKNGKRYYMPKNYTDEEYARLTEAEREEDWKLSFNGSFLQDEDIYMFVDLQRFVLDIEGAELTNND